MKVQFTFKHMESSQALMDLAEEKLMAKVHKFTMRPLKAHITFSVEGLVQKMHVSLVTGDGFDIEAEHAGSTLYSEIDVVCEKVESQLRKHKERLKSRSAESLRKGAVLVSDDTASWNEQDSVDPSAIDAAEILKFENHSIQSHSQTGAGK